MLATTLLVAASVPVLGYVGVKAVLDSTGGRDATADNLPVQTFPFTPAALHLATDDDGMLSSVAVMVLAPSGTGGSIVTVPINTDVGASPAERRSLQQVYAEEGAESMAATVESLLLVAINITTVADPAQLVRLLEPYEPFTVELAGDEPAVLAADAAAGILTEGAAEVDPNARQAAIDAVWVGVVSSVGPGRAPSGPLASGPVEEVPATFDEFAARLFAGQIQTRGLGVTPFSGTDDLDNLGVVQLDKAEAVLVFASIAPGSMSSPAPGPRLRLQAPPGYDLRVKETIETLQFVKANVVSVDVSAEPQAQTTILVPDESNRGLVQTTDELFGDVVFATPTARIDGVDATIILGTDYLERTES